MTIEEEKMINKKMKKLKERIPDIDSGDLVTYRDFKIIAIELNRYKFFLSVHKRNTLSEFSNKIKDIENSESASEAKLFVEQAGVLAGHLLEDQDCHNAFIKWKRLKNGILLSLIIVLIAILMIVGVYFQVPFIINVLGFIGTLPNWLATVILLTIGLFLFWLRSKIRIAYAAFELVFGLSTIFLKINTIGFAFSDLGFPDYVTIFGGLYILVRGLDNLTEGLRSVNYGDLWVKFFTT